MIENCSYIMDADLFDTIALMNIKLVIICQRSCYMSQDFSGFIPLSV
jgi:hypothetical protein